MKKVKTVCWQDEGMWIDHLQIHPDYLTQGETLEELKENLKDIFKDINDGLIPNVKTNKEIII